MHFFCNLVMKICVLSRKPTCFSRRIHKNLIQKFWTTLLMPKWKCQCFDRNAREPSNMMKAREQSKTLNYTDPFKIDQIILHEIFSRFRVLFEGNLYLRKYSLNYSLHQFNMQLKLFNVWIHVHFFIFLSRRILYKIFEKTLYIFGKQSYILTF